MQRIFPTHHRAVLIQILTLAVTLCALPSLGTEVTPPSAIRKTKGFQVELLRSATQGEDSWVSMTFDEQGRIYLGLDRQGVGRLTLTDDNQVLFDRIDSTLKHCRGVLWAHNSLYVDATNSQQLVRLTDPNRDGKFESRSVLVKFDYRSRYGHGSNQMRLGPDGMIYVVIGNDVAFPDDTRSTSPYRHPQNDWLLPERHDLGHDNRVGFILRMDQNGKQREILAGGFRNQVDMAFDANGEMFTFDADMEWDIGTPWYRPIRVNHIVSGGEYGWRWGTGKWPAYYPDSLPSNLDVGMGSPTGVVFGTNSQFPVKYRRALFLADWQNGRILAAHPRPAGASYTFEYESFLDGAPLNVCDMEFGSDGKLYFITGGRGSQSALYRVSWTGAGADGTPDALTNPPLTDPQRRRRKIETFHRHPTAGAIDIVWPDLGSADPWIRYAARIAVERQPLEQWESRVFAEPDTTTAIHGLIALTRMKQTIPSNRLAFQSKVIDKLATVATQSQLDSSTQISVLRVAGLLFARHGQPDKSSAGRVVELVRPWFPHTDERLNCELCELLIFLEDTQSIEPAFTLLDDSSISQETQIHVARTLAHVPQPWSIAQHRTYVKWLNRARRLRGGKLLQTNIQHMQNDFVTSLTEQQQQALSKELAALTQPIEETITVAARPLVQQWKLADLLDLATPNTKGDVANGRQIFVQAQCSRCHRIQNTGAQIGPDLTSVSRRYNRRALLESIIHPSEQIDPKYTLTTYALDDGKIYTGRVDGVNSKSLTLETDPIRQTKVTIQRNAIEATSAAKASPMPAGLLDSFSRDEIRDLLAFLTTQQ